MCTGPAAPATQTTGDPNIALIRIHESNVKTRAVIVAQLIENVRNGRVMVFVPTMKVGSEVQTALNAVGCELPFYYGQLAADSTSSDGSPGH